MWTPGVMALLVTVASLALGGGYYLYLIATPFPPAAARVIPFLWLLAVVVGVVLGIKAVLGNAGRGLGLISIILAIPSALVAIIFSVAALMGD